METATFDLSANEQQDTGVYRLLKPDGEKTHVVFTLAGPTHPVREAYEKRNARRGIKTFNKHGKAQLPEDPDELLEQTIERVAKCTLGWTGLALDASGTPHEYSPERAQVLFGNPKLAWIREQVDAALRDLQLFMKGSSAS